MLDLFSGLLSLFLNDTPKAEILRSTDWSTWLSPALVQSFTVSEPDPAAETVLKQHLAAMAAMGLSVDGQGVWIQSGNGVLAEHLGKTPLSAASLTKIATTLAALTTWGPDYQFETVISATGTIRAGVLQGDLVVQGGGDPFFVWEEAIALGNALNRVGIQQVTGNLVIVGNFAMNFETNAAKAGSFLKQGLDAKLWSDDVEAQYQNLPRGTPRPQVNIQGAVQVMPIEAIAASTVLIRHESPPLATILKGMNTYSNNVMSEMLASSLGGAKIVAQKAAELAQIPPEEIQLSNGSGLGIENRISPRAITAMLIAIQRYLQPRQLDIADLFAVVGQDQGTPAGRHIPDAAVVKTGTLDQVSSLAGVLPTRDRGLVWFAIINLGTGDIGNFHDQQDRLLQNLQTAWGAASSLPPSIRPGDRTSNPVNWLGNASRNQVVWKG